MLRIYPTGYSDAIVSVGPIKWYIPDSALKVEKARDGLVITASWIHTPDTGVPQVLEGLEAGYKLPMAVIKDKKLIYVGSPDTYTLVHALERLRETLNLMSDIELVQTMVKKGQTWESHVIASYDMRNYAAAESSFYVHLVLQGSLNELQRVSRYVYDELSPGWKTHKLIDSKANVQNPLRMSVLLTGTTTPMILMRSEDIIYGYITTDIPDIIGAVYNKVDGIMLPYLNVEEYETEIVPRTPARLVAQLRTKLKVALSTFSTIHTLLYPEKVYRNRLAFRDIQNTMKIILFDSTINTDVKPAIEGVKTVKPVPVGAIKVGRDGVWIRIVPSKSLKPGVAPPRYATWLNHLGAHVVRTILPRITKTLIGISEDTRVSVTVEDGGLAVLKAIDTGGRERTIEYRVKIDNEIFKATYGSPVVIHTVKAEDKSQKAVITVMHPLTAEKTKHLTQYIEAILKSFNVNSPKVYATAMILGLIRAPGEDTREYDNTILLKRIQNSI